MVMIAVVSYSTVDATRPQCRPHVRLFRSGQRQGAEQWIGCGLPKHRFPRRYLSRDECARQSSRSGLRSALILADENGGQNASAKRTSERKGFGDQMVRCEREICA